MNDINRRELADLYMTTVNINMLRERVYSDRDKGEEVRHVSANILLRARRHIEARMLQREHELGRGSSVDYVFEEENKR